MKGISNPCSSCNLTSCAVSFSESAALNVRWIVVGPRFETIQDGWHMNELRDKCQVDYYDGGSMGPP